MTHSPHLRRGLTAVLALGVAAAIAGCSPVNLLPGAQGSAAAGSTAQSDPQGAALDAFVAAAQPQMADLQTQLSSTYTSVTLRAVHPASIEYVYRYKQAVDPEKAGEYFDGQLSTFQDVIDKQVFPSMRSAGLTGDLGVIYTYEDPDGTQLWTHAFTPSS